jgi:hypothetical protein
MESYYQMQEIVPDDQWLDFMAACRKLSVFDMMITGVLLTFSIFHVYDTDG